MQTYLFIAGILAIIVGAIHSVMGEILIFRQMRVSGIVPTNGAPLLRAITKGAACQNSMGELAYCDCIWLGIRSNYSTTRISNR